MADSTATATAQKAATTRKTNATRRSTAAQKAAATRHRTTAAKQAAEAKQEMKTPVVRAGEIVEKAVFVPVGVALTARDTVIETIDELRSTYSTRNKAEQQLRRYERRGSSAFKRIERELRQRRARIERELKRNRSRIEKELRTMPVAKNVELASARVENVVASGRNAAAKVQERLTALA